MLSIWRITESQFPHSCSSDPSPPHTPVQPQCSNRRSCLQRRQLPQHQSWKRNNWIVFHGSHWTLQINRNSRKMSIRVGGAEGLSDRISCPRCVFSVQPLCQVGQTPSHVRILRCEMRLWGCTWVLGTVLCRDQRRMFGQGSDLDPCNSPIRVMFDFWMCRSYLRIGLDVPKRGSVDAVISKSGQLPCGARATYSLRDFLFSSIFIHGLYLIDDSI